LTTILLTLILAPIAYLAVKHFWASRKPTKRQAIPFPFPILQGRDQLNAYGEPRAFRPVDSAMAPRNKAFDWPQP
jgi:hypothetical protein